ncbi:MAG: STAS domain-containing protein [Peptoniphilus sp.]|uniref:STAS domain-containing protein n=1 Tax=Peptoniphilus sp. TaxID=1971214 RepID=UPI0025F64CEE|nr:STAS domain-containing protein [Peptoniphilus sp.]MCI5643277.1 STAS domain-containing protein [Peptoniphilus sp.]MDD7352647.1 STAS domain-containing protein [Peptoniphilaceae bacterium]MDY3902517.1 STAS domain-containing protein [Peptoniphilus sp.]
MEFKLESKNTDEFLILYPKGELDVYNTKKFKEKSIKYYEKCKKDILFDCSDLEYLDSTGLGSLIYILKELEKDGNKIVIENLNKSIMKLFKITKLDDMFEIRG